MIDARSATGTPCITTLPQRIPDFLVPDNLTEWQEKLLNAWGFTTTPPDASRPHSPPTTR